MECEKVRDRFSSLLEADLSPSEETSVTEHLASCSACQKDFETFKKTMDWLHSVEELETPEGFLSGIYQKMEDRQRVRSSQGWVHRFKRMNLPAQAVAMVAILFAVLYLTQMVPMDAFRSRKVDQPIADSAPSEKKAEEAMTKIAGDKKETAQEEKAKPEATSVAVVKPPPAEGIKTDATLLAKRAPATESASRPLEEIVFRTSHPESFLSQLQKIVKQFGGEIVQQEGYVLIALLPAASLSDLTKEVEQRQISKGMDKAPALTESPKALKLSPRSKEKAEEERRVTERPIADQQGLITIRFVVIKEE